MRCLSLFNPTLAIWIAYLLLNTSAFAQPVGNSSSQARSLGNDLQERQNTDQLWPDDNNPSPAFTLPKLPAPNADNPISQRLKFYCQTIRLTGNTVFPSTELEKITLPYSHRELSNQELQQLRYQLTRYYVDHGYINSGAVIPDQTLKDSILEIQLIEGKLDQIQIHGIEHFNREAIQERIALAADNPLQVNRLQDNLQLLLENPLIERINAELLPGAQPGSAILKTLLKEKNPYQFGMIFDNQIAPSLGGYQGTSYAGYRNLTGLGDAFTAQGRFAPGMTGVGIDYWLPLNRYDTTFHTWYSHYDSNIVEQPFNQIDVTSNSQAYGINLTQPLIHHPGLKLSGTLTLEHRQSLTSLLGQPFSFSPGVQNGKSSVTVLRIGQEWLQRSTEQVFAARSVFNVGLDALDATINTAAPDGRFFSWLGQLQWGQRLRAGQLIWRGDMQLANDGLLPLEKFQIGGANSVRGYRENQIVRDSGFSTSLEYRYPIFSDFFGQEKFFIAPFADLGRAWNVGNYSTTTSLTGSGNMLASTGFGFIWEPTRKIHTHLYWGQTLIAVNNPHQDPQDYGFHFKLAGQFL